MKSKTADFATLVTALCVFTDLHFAVTDTGCRRYFINIELQFAV